MVNDKWRRHLRAGLLTAGFLGACGLWAFAVLELNKVDAPASPNALSEASSCARSVLLVQASTRRDREAGGGPKALPLTNKDVRQAERSCEEAASQAPATRTILDDQMKVLFASVQGR